MINILHPIWRNLLTVIIFVTKITHRKIDSKQSKKICDYNQFSVKCPSSLLYYTELWPSLIPTYYVYLYNPQSLPFYYLIITFFAQFSPNILPTMFSPDLTIQLSNQSNKTTILLNNRPIIPHFQIKTKFNLILS